MIEEINGRLLMTNQSDYMIVHKRPFENPDDIPRDYVIECIDFSYNMAFGQGEHRDHRSGGSYERKPGEIFANTLQGKIAEFAMYHFMLTHNMEVSYPDMTIAKRGVWDSFDLDCYGKKIAVKSTKYYGQLLLLETKDWNENAEYIPNFENGHAEYDVFVLIRIKPSAEDTLKKMHKLYSFNMQKQEIQSIFINMDWKYDIAGYITKGDLHRIIDAKYVIPKGAKLNGRTIMDADNYYVQAGDMRNIHNFVKLLEANKKLNNIK